MALIFYFCFLIPLNFALSKGSSEIKWVEFKEKFGKKYESPEDEMERKEVFLSTLEEVEKHNIKFEQGLSTYQQGINYFSDWTWDEFQAKYLNKISVTDEEHCEKIYPHSSKKLFSPKDVPLSKDWRNMMPPAKNQGGCGSCWAFAATGATEGAWAVAGNSPISLSEQQMIDCGRGGCGGGGYLSFTYIVENGLSLEEDYPYEAKDGECRYDPSMKAVSASRCIIYEPDYNHNLELYDLMARFSDRPHAISVAATASFQRYQSGIFDEECEGQTNHAVVNVGYDGVEEYWIIRNSWGRNWGEDGHIRIKMGGDLCNNERDRMTSIFI